MLTYCCPKASVLGVAALFLALITPLHPSAAGAPIIVGLDADMSAGSALGGEAIRRGAALAIDEINATGGPLGRPLELVVRDHRGNPDRGVDNILEFAAMDDLVAVVGGIHTPVAMAELDALHEHRIIYLDPWAAGTAVVDNGRDPNFVFRVSVRDEYAGEFLIKAAFERGYRKPGLLLWQTAWGRSNEQAMTAALAKRNAAPAGVQWFNTGTKDVMKQLRALRAAGADVIMLVAQPNGGIATIKGMAAAAQKDRLPIIAHWGFTGGDFHKNIEEVATAVDLTFLQTYSFFEPPFPDRADRILTAYCSKFDACGTPGEVFAPVGTAHAYDLIHLLARAIEAAGTIDREQVRQALETLERYDGLVRTYDPPFTPNHHDALDQSDFHLATYDKSGFIVPVPMH